MAPTRRLIARLDIKPPDLIKTVNLEGVRIVGDPLAFATRYNDEGADELIYLDAVASLYRRNGILDLVERATEHVFCPVTVGGGLQSLEDARRAFNAGADKIALNSAVVRRPELITELAHKYGNQAVVLQIDAKRKLDGSYEAYTDGGREPSGKDAVAWAQEAAARGAGEILVTSIDREGTRRGCDTELVQGLSDIRVPVVISGGIGRPEHVIAAFRAGADAVAMAHVLHYRTCSLADIRMAATEAGFHVRPVEAVTEKETI